MLLLMLGLAVLRKLCIFLVEVNLDIIPEFLVMAALLVDSLQVSLIENVPSAMLSKDLSVINWGREVALPLLHKIFEVIWHIASLRDELPEEERYIEHHVMPYEGLLMLYE